MPENQIIESLLGIIRKEVNLLREMQNISKEDYLKDEKAQHIVERAFQQSIQSCIDMSARLISLKNFPVPDNYHKVFEILAEKGVIKEGLCKKMHEMVGLRNVLIHEYRWIKNEEVYRHLQENIDVLKEFAEAFVKNL